MMEHLGYLFAGFAVFWAGLFAYLLWLQARLRSVRRELERLEERLAERDPSERIGTGMAGESASERTGSSG
jgi:CcmD family protein